MLQYLCSSAKRGRFAPPRVTAPRNTRQLCRTVPGGRWAHGKCRRRDRPTRQETGRHVCRTVAIEARSDTAANLRCHGWSSFERRPRQASHRQGRSKSVAWNSTSKRSVASEGWTLRPEDKGNQGSGCIHEATSAETKDPVLWSSVGSGHLRSAGLQQVKGRALNIVRKIRLFGYVPPMDFLRLFEIKSFYYKSFSDWKM